MNIDGVLLNPSVHLRIIRSGPVLAHSAIQKKTMEAYYIVVNKGALFSGLNSIQKSCKQSQSVRFTFLLEFDVRRIAVFLDSCHPEEPFMN